MKRRAVKLKNFSFANVEESYTASSTNSLLLHIDCLYEGRDFLCPLGFSASDPISEMIFNDKLAGRRLTK